MAINRFTQRVAAQPEFYQTNLDALRIGLEGKQQRYDKYQMLSDQIGETSINAMDPDRAGANALVRRYNEMLDKTVDQYSGDYSKMGKDLYGLARTIKQDLSPGGQGHAYETSFKNYNEWLNRSREAAAKGIINPEQLDAANAYMLSQYKGAVKDPVTQAYSTFNSTEIAPYVEAQEVVKQAIMAAIPKKVQEGVWHVDENNLIWKKTSTGRELLTQQELMEIGRNALQSHGGYQTYKNQMSQFGRPIDETMENLAIQTWAQARDVDNRVYDESIMVNPFLRDRMKGSSEELPARTEQRYRITEGYNTNPEAQRNMGDIPSYAKDNILGATGRSIGEDLTGSFSTSLKQEGWKFLNNPFVKAITGWANPSMMAGTKSPVNAISQIFTEGVTNKNMEELVGSLNIANETALNPYRVTNAFNAPSLVQSLLKGREVIASKGFDGYVGTTEFDETFGPEGKLIIENMKKAPESVLNTSGNNRKKSKAFIENYTSYLADQTSKIDTYIEADEHAADTYYGRYIGNNSYKSGRYSGVSNKGVRFDNLTFDDALKAMGIKAAEWDEYAKDNKNLVAGYSLPSSPLGAGPLFFSPKGGTARMVLQDTEARTVNSVMPFDQLQQVDPISKVSPIVSLGVGPTNVFYRQVDTSGFDPRTGDYQKGQRKVERIELVSPNDPPELGPGNADMDENGQMYYKENGPYRVFITSLDEVAKTWAEMGGIDKVPGTEKKMIPMSKAQ